MILPLTMKRSMIWKAKGERKKEEQLPKWESELLLMLFLLLLQFGNPPKPNHTHPLRGRSCCRLVNWLLCQHTHTHTLLTAAIGVAVSTSTQRLHCWRRRLLRRRRQRRRHRLWPPVLMGVGGGDDGRWSGGGTGAGGGRSIRRRLVTL